MSSTTSNIGLILPEGQEHVSRSILNSNFTMIDGAFGTLADFGLPTVTNVETQNGIMTITVACHGFAFGEGLVFPVLFPEDIATENIGTLMMNIGGSGAKYLELHITKMYTFNNIDAGVHFVECTTTPLEYTTGTEVYALYQTGICGTIDGMRITDWLASKADVDNPVFTGSISLGRKADTAIGNGSVALGSLVTASGAQSHAEGYNTKATAAYSHAEGNATKASSVYSHAEGNTTEASELYAHAEGSYSIASGQASHAEGYDTRASSNYQHVAGKFNVEDSNGTYAEIIGNGTGDSARSNARTLDWFGNESLTGSLTLGKGTANEITITASQLKQLLALLN